MATTFEYSIIRVEPDSSRGERVNVGVVVFNRGNLDVRVVETRKATAIASKDWDGYIRDFSENLTTLYASQDEPKALVSLVETFSRQVKLTELGWFIAKSAQEYETEVKRIIFSLVKKPAPLRYQRHETSIATAIAAEFKQANILSVQGEGLESGKVVRNYSVDADVSLVADFALKNGCLHFATTLDLTSASPHIGSAASKAVTMDLAVRANHDAKTYGVYAVAPSRKLEVKEHISLLGDYSSDVYNWYEPSDRERFKRAFFDAYSSNFPTEIERRAIYNN